MPKYWLHDFASWTEAAWRSAAISDAIAVQTPEGWNNSSSGWSTESAASVRNPGNAK